MENLINVRAELFSQNAKFYFSYSRRAFCILCHNIDAGKWQKNIEDEKTFHCSLTCINTSFPASSPYFGLSEDFAIFQAPTLVKQKQFTKRDLDEDYFSSTPLEIQCTNAMPTHRIMRTTTTTITKVIQMTANTRSKQQKQKQLIKKWKRFSKVVWQESSNE